MVTRLRRWVIPALMMTGAASTFLTWDIVTGGQTLFGLDFRQLHQFRIAWAQAALWGPEHTLPGWYSRELLGTPFWSNLQNFPWTVLRSVIFLFPATHVFAPAVALAAALSSLFTYLFLRALGLREIPAAVAGWTFACSGFFAARVTAGHLPLLEAYPALPLFLWLVERYFQSATPRRWLMALALCACSVVLSGHPQLPLYAMLSACAYALVRGGRRASWPIAAAVTGAGLSLFAWWPMLLLLRRSTRVLSLDAPTQDIAMPWARLDAFFFPWADGWPSNVAREPAVPFHGFPNPAYFWDTVCYVGWLPWLAVLFLFGATLARRMRPSPPAIFLIALGVIATALALPLVQPLRELIPGTLVRSPARLLYLTIFALSAGLGFALHQASEWLSLRNTRLAWGVLAAFVVVQVADVGTHARAFVTSRPSAVSLPTLEQHIAENLGDARIAVDKNIPVAWNRAHDDVGFFDSVMLARPYEALLALANIPLTTNTQSLNGSSMSVRALRSAGVRYVVTPGRPPDLSLVAEEGGVRLYEVASPAPRAQFFATGMVGLARETEVHARLQAPDTVLGNSMVLVNETAASAPALTPAPITARWSRPSPDELTVDVETEYPGSVRVLESWDEGWSATVDGVPAPILNSDGFLLAARVEPGVHHVEFRFRTPGAFAGVGLSLLFAALVAAVIVLHGRAPRGPSNPIASWDRH